MILIIRDGIEIMQKYDLENLQCVKIKLKSCLHSNAAEFNNRFLALSSLLLGTHTSINMPSRCWTEAAALLYNSSK